MGRTSEAGERDRTLLLVSFKQVEDDLTRPSQLDTATSKRQ
jgi:hypothetical protein